MIAGILSFAGTMFLFWQWPLDTPFPPSEKLNVQLMTSLPIVWGEGASMENILSEETVPAPIYKHWQEQYNLEAVDSFEDLKNSGTDVVILAQPRAMDPADLAAIDDWVRTGGNVLILTDPALLWHSDFPLGDNRRPLTSGLLSPLLGHWGLELLAPGDDGPGDDGEGVIALGFRDFAIFTAGVGSFQRLDGNGAGKVKCLLSDANIIAQCQVGKGRAILVADADFLHEEFWVDDQAWQAQKKSSAMRFTDSLMAEFSSILSIPND